MTIDETIDIINKHNSCLNEMPNCSDKDTSCENCKFHYDYFKLREIFNNIPTWLSELKDYREKELKHIHDILPPVHNCKLFDFEKFYRDEHDKQIREDIIKELNAKGYLFDTDEYGDTVGRNDEFWIELMKRKNNE